MNTLEGYLRNELPPMVILVGAVFAALVVFALSILALMMLRTRPLPPLAQVIWAVLIVTAPFMGSIAFLIVQPRGDAKTGESIGG